MNLQMLNNKELVKQMAPQGMSYEEALKWIGKQQSGSTDRRKQQVKDGQLFD